MIWIHNRVKIWRPRTFRFCLLENLNCFAWVLIGMLTLFIVWRGEQEHLMVHTLCRLCIDMFAAVFRRSAAQKQNFGWICDSQLEDFVYLFTGGGAGMTQFAGMMPSGDQFGGGLPSSAAGLPPSASGLQGSRLSQVPSVFQQHNTVAADLATSMANMGINQMPRQSQLEVCNHGMPSVHRRHGVV